MDEITQLKEKIEILEKLLFALVKSDKYYFGKHIVLADGLNISFSSGTGTKIGTGTGQKLAFFNAPPVAQQASIADADGTLADATIKINAILDVLDAFGLTA